MRRQSRAAAALEPAQQRRILIVDDDPVFTLLASETLQQAGYATFTADRAEAALEMFAENPPDLLILDVELPGKSGLEICTTLRGTPLGTDVPIVVVTAHNDTASISDAYLAGATDFIPKPVLWQTLPQRLGFILRAQDNIRALRLSEQKNRALLQALPDTIYIVDRRGVLMEHITGVENAGNSNLVGRNIEDVVPAEVARAGRRAIDAKPEERAVTNHEFDVGSGPERRCFETRLRPQADGSLLVVTRDTTERRRAEARIKYLAYYDTLTGLPNRQAFVREAGRAMRAAKRNGTSIALLYLDLDRFKRINDNLGHATGDALLKSVALRLEQSVRAPEASGSETPHHERGRIARLGGDEFVVLLTNVRDEGDTIPVADRIRSALGEPFDCGGHRFVVTPSIGIALYPKDGTDIDDLLVKADMAMYQAKDKGRNNHAFYGESMAIRSLSRLELEIDLRRAFEARHFSVHYQPKIDLASGRIVGLEALLRWHHETRGWIRPEIFVPVAEETGLIVLLGDWMLEQACQQLKRWAGTALDHLNIAVNVSAQQFARADFVESVLRTVLQTGVRADRLELEITESLLMRNVEDTAACMKQFRAAGIALSIDDFGTGYSSLGRLRQFPVDMLKIDRSFVADLHTSSDDAAICAAIIAMARELKLKVVAEGVETEEQLKFLREHHCDLAQGYLLGKPAPLVELEPRLQTPYPMTVTGPT